MQGSNQIESSFAKRAMHIGLILLGLIAALFIVFTPLAAGAADLPEETPTVDDSVDDDANVPAEEPVGEEAPAQDPVDDTSTMNEEGASDVTEEAADDSGATDGDVTVPADETAVVDDSADAGDSSAVTDKSKKPETSKTEVIETEDTDEVADMSTVVEKVDICHATAATKNPYTSNNVAVESIIQTPNGHNGHTGEVFAEGMTSGWGDIIPPFSYVENQGGDTSYYPGMNWDEAGMAIFNNGCKVTVPTTPPTTTPPTTTPPTTTPPTTPAEKVEICHATASTSNPYVLIEPAVESVIQTPNGHNGHTGEVFTEGMTSGWGDIIPPFSYVENQGGDTSYYPGMNWDEAGMAIFNNDCKVTVATTPPTTPPTTTPPTTPPTTTPPTTAPPVTTPPETTPETTPVTTKPAASESIPPKTEVVESEEDSSNGLAQTGASLLPQVLAGSIVLLLAGTTMFLVARRRQEQ